MPIERIKITTNRFLTRDALGQISFDSNNQYLKTQAGAQFLTGGIDYTTVIAERVSGSGPELIPPSKMGALSIPIWTGLYGPASARTDSEVSTGAETTARFDQKPIVEIASSEAAPFLSQGRYNYLGTSSIGSAYLTAFTGSNLFSTYNVQNGTVLAYSNYMNYTYNGVIAGTYRLVGLQRFVYRPPAGRSVPGSLSFKGWWFHPIDIVPSMVINTAGTLRFSLGSTYSAVPTFRDVLTTNSYWQAAAFINLTKPNTTLALAVTP